MHTCEPTYDVVALGELLIDFTSCGNSVQGNSLFEANPGGAPGNFLAMLAKLGHRTALIGKVGRDQFGLYLEKTLKECGIGTENLILDPIHHTTLAFVHNDESGDRDFTFYRDPGADMMLTPQEIAPSLLRRTQVFHFGTISMTHEGVREATLHALSLARDNGCLISFDPNIRPPLWTSLDDACTQLHKGLSQSHVAKISAEELQLAAGTDDLDAATGIILQQYPGLRFLTLTMGQGGSRAYYGGTCIQASTFLDVKPSDTTGAGDTFGACIMSHILRAGLDNLTPAGIRHMLLFANAAATIVTTRKGALRIMPERQEIDTFLQRYDLADMTSDHTR